MTQVGVVGLGFMGMVHYLSYQKLQGVNVVAICEQLAHRLQGDWTDIKGNFGPPGEKMDLSGVRTYSTIEEVLADPDIDLIDITLPPNMHAETAIKSLRAGKHVFCEKPMSLTTEDCQQMFSAATSNKMQLYVGHVLPFFPEYAWALEIVKSGEYGKVLGGSFKRVISDPSWLTNYWLADRIGGPMLDLHVHDAHFIRLLFGTPNTISTQGRIREGLAEYWNTQFDYGDKAVHATSGTINQQGRPFLHGFEINLEQATIAFEFAVTADGAKYLCQPTLFDSSGKELHPELGDGDPMNAFAAELSEVVACVKAERSSELLNAELARDAVKLCEKQTESLHRNCPIKF